MILDLIVQQGVMSDLQCWTVKEEETLIDLVKNNPLLYAGDGFGRSKSIQRNCKWQEIGSVLNKPAEECRKRWQRIKYNYVRHKLSRAVPNSISTIFKKLYFLDDIDEDGINLKITVKSEENDNELEEIFITEAYMQDNDPNNLFEVTIQDEPGNKSDDINSKTVEITPSNNSKVNFTGNSIKHKRLVHGPRGRKKSIPVTRNLKPVNILPKPSNRTPLIVYTSLPTQLIRLQTTRVNNAKHTEPTTVVSDKSNMEQLLERLLRENINDIDNFFRRMAAKVKKLPSHLIPKVKAEVCNVVTKYEMQSLTFKTSK